MDLRCASPDGVPVSTIVGVGCITGFAGMFAGAMIAVFVAKFVGSIRGCQPAEGMPACEWHVYAAVGMILGLLTLPTISIIRLTGRRS